MTPLPRPELDPTAIFELFRGSYGSELLAAAIAHFDVFGTLLREPMTREQFAEQIGLQQRPAVVLSTALLAMGFLQQDGNGILSLTKLAEEHLVPGCPFDVGNYVGLAATSPGVLEMVERLRTNQPANLSGEGAAFIYRDGMKSAMEQAELAEHFTLALAGRARNVAPFLAEVLDLSNAKTMVDVGGGTGIYSIACLRAAETLTATVLDRPEVLTTAADFAKEYEVTERIKLVAADMFADDIPPSDIVLLSNILHDWDVAECRQLVQRCAQVLNPGGQLVIHDVLLNNRLDGPLPIALYSSALFTLTEGRAYSAAEFSGWLEEAGLTVEAPRPTLIHCHALVGRDTRHKST